MALYSEESFGPVAAVIRARDGDGAFTGCQIATRGTVTVEEAANEVVRLGLSEDRWQKLGKRGRTYSREMAETATDDDAL